MHRPAFRRIEGPPHDPNAPTDEPTDPAPRERWAPTRSRHPIAYAGDKGFDLAPTPDLIAKLVRYRADLRDPAAPPALRDYAAAAIVEIRAELARRQALPPGQAA